MGIIMTELNGDCASAIFYTLLQHKSMLSTVLISQKAEHSARSTSLRCRSRVECCWHNGGIYI